MHGPSDRESSSQVYLAFASQRRDAIASLIESRGEIFTKVADAGSGHVQRRPQARLSTITPGTLRSTFRLRTV